MKKKLLIVFILILMSGMVFMTACSSLLTEEKANDIVEKIYSKTENITIKNNQNNEGNITEIALSDDVIQVNGKVISDNVSAGVFAANDIVFYQEGNDFTYGEGESRDEHSRQEAAEHRVVHIEEAGTYRIRGHLSKGQIAVDLGTESYDDPSAVVNIILDGAEISCSVAPAIIFYNVYECGPESVDDPQETETSAAGANIIIADGSENTVNGAYVAKIYKSYDELGKDSDGGYYLHKYDAAIFSKMSMNISGEKENTGLLNVSAVNEGIGSDKHLTINGGNIRVIAGNDGINACGDDVSVLTINDGNLFVLSDGSYVGGDGIDSNGWLIINGGIIFAQASPGTDDSGLDASKSIIINGGMVNSSGDKVGKIDKKSRQNTVVFGFKHEQHPGQEYRLIDPSGANVISFDPENPFKKIMMSCGNLADGEYVLYRGNQAVINPKVEKKPEEDSKKLSQDEVQKTENNLSEDNASPEETPAGDTIFSEEPEKVFSIVAGPNSYKDIG